VQSCQGPGSSPLTLACSASWTSRRFRYASVSESMQGSYAPAKGNDSKRQKASQRQSSQAPSPCTGTRQLAGRQRQSNHEKYSWWRGRRGAPLMSGRVLAPAG
jgi:hypothetical protein